jgi:hypothetical protein
MKLKFLSLWLSVLLFSFLLIVSLSVRVSANDDSEYLKVNLSYLAAHLEDFSGKKVRTVGSVHYLASIYMYEDFWLSRAIPVVVRFAELPVPPEHSFIEVFGTIEYCHLEGGFFYLNADYWAYAGEKLPEFQSLMLPLFLLATLLAVIAYKKKHTYIRQRDGSITT